LRGIDSKKKEECLYLSARSWGNEGRKGPPWWLSVNEREEGGGGGKLGVNSLRLLLRVRRKEAAEKVPRVLPRVKGRGGCLCSVWKRGRVCKARYWREEYDVRRGVYLPFLGRKGKKEKFDRGCPAFYETVIGRKVTSRICYEEEGLE